MDVVQVPERASVRIIATITVVALGLGFLLRPPPTTPYLFVDNVVARAPELVHKPLRVHGFVQPGSIQTFGNLHRFALVRDKAALETWVYGPVPDAFRDDAEIIVEGQLEQMPSGDWMLEGTSMMAKCAIKYDSEIRDRLDATFR